MGTPTPSSASSLKGAFPRARASVIEISRHLIEARERPGDQHFSEWLRKEFPDWRRRTAYNYICVAERFSPVQGLALLPVTREALYLLPGP